jgi:hypothetical protein
VRYSRSVTGTPAVLSSWKKATNMAPARDRIVASGYRDPKASPASEVNFNGCNLGHHNDDRLSSILSLVEAGADRKP